jgi:iron-sulfur cluster assembly protein
LKRPETGRLPGIVQTMGGSMLTLTDAAKGAVRDIVDDSGVPEGSGIRIVAGTDAGGTDRLSLSIATAPAEGDAVLDEEGTRVFLNQEAADALDDKILDAETQADGIHFSVRPQ